MKLIIGHSLNTVFFKISLNKYSEFLDLIKNKALKIVYGKLEVLL